MDSYTTKRFGKLLKPNFKENFWSLKHISIRKKFTLEREKIDLVSSARLLLVSTGEKIKQKS